MHFTATIFMVDDDVDDFMLYHDIFKERDAGIELSFFRNPEGFICYLDKLTLDQLPDLIISDLNMPKLNGHELLLQLKASDRYKTIPLLIISTSTSVLDKDKCIKGGARGYFSKPVTMLEFQVMVDKIIQQFVKTK
jgi:CheY-like chemotaxis protein